jgi:hypothetical protein
VEAEIQGERQKLEQWRQKSRRRRKSGPSSSRTPAAEPAAPTKAGARPSSSMLVVWTETNLHHPASRTRASVSGLLTATRARYPLRADSLFAWLIHQRASSTFLSEQTSHQQPVSSTFLSEQISTSHQPPAKRIGPEAVPPDRILVASSGQRRRTAPQSHRWGHHRRRHVARVDNTASRRWVVGSARKEAQVVVGPSNCMGKTVISHSN